eukprot:scaffold3315_cov26-Attheya_sp.AAC.2
MSERPSSEYIITNTTAIIHVCCRVTGLLFFVGTVAMVLMGHVMTSSALGVADGYNPCRHSTIYEAIHNEDHHEDNG